MTPSVASVAVGTTLHWDYLPSSSSSFFSSSRLLSGHDCPEDAVVMLLEMVFDNEIKKVSKTLEGTKFANLATKSE